MHIKTITTRQTFIEAIQLQGIVQVKEYKLIKKIKQDRRQWRQEVDSLYVFL